MFNRGFGQGWKIILLRSREFGIRNKERMLLMDGERGVIV
jgi:hypothetical protein